MQSNQPRRTDRQPAALRLLVVGSSRGTLTGARHERPDSEPCYDHGSIGSRG